jgi:Tol biopolymer transport system component
MRRVTVLLEGAALAAGPLLAVLAAVKPAEAAFPGTNGLIVFSSDRTTTANPDGDEEIFTMKPDGTSVTQLTDNTGGENVFDFAPSDFDPAFSADGTKIAFVSTRDRTQEIYTMDADGSNEARLVPGRSADSLREWSGRQRRNLQDGL